MHKKLAVSLGLVCLLVLPLAPGLALAPLGLGRGVGTWALAAIASTLASVLVSPALGVRVAGVLAIATALGLLAAPTPWAAALVMAAGAALYGRSSRWGVSSAIVMAPVALGFAMAERVEVLESASGTTNAAVVGALVLAAGLWGVVVGWALGTRAPHRPLEPIPVRRANAFAVVIALTTGTTMGVVSALGLGHTGGWVLLTLFVVIQPSLNDTWTKTAHRLLGTALGFVIAYVVGVLVPAEWLLYLIAVACVVVAAIIRLTPGRPYWQYATFLTPAVVLLEGAGGSVLDTDRDRLIATACGAAVAIVIVAVTTPIYRVMERRAQTKGHTPDR